MEEWEIAKSLGYCYGTGRKIEPGQQYVATLVQTEEGLQRRDFCIEYWQREKPEVFCYWKTTLPHPDQKRHIFVDDDMLMAFFERLENETEQEKVNFRFVLMLILVRRRKLKYDSTRIEQGREIWRLRVVGGDGRYVEVVNPNLSEQEIEQLSSQLGQILQTEL